MANELGKRISQLLIKNGLTQRELAKIVGVTEVSMSRYISGDRTPKGPIVANIATALHTTSDYILGTEEPTSSESDYNQIYRLIARTAGNFSSSQKRELINVILAADPN